MTSCWGQHNTSRSPLKKVLLESLLCAPCWPEAQDAENPDVFALGGLQLRKGGEGNEFAFVQLKLTLSLLLPEDNRPISGGERGPGGHP